MENKEKKKHKKNEKKIKEQEIRDCNCPNEECICENDCSCDDDRFYNTEVNEKIKFLEDNLLRSQAELINYKRRKDEETSRMLKYANEDILSGFLPILDNFERAIAMDDTNLSDEVSKFLVGFKLMDKQIRDLLSSFDVTEIECLGKEFDPTYHQAVSTVKDENSEPGMVAVVLQKGYMYKDRVLRPAMVQVSE